VAQKNPGSQNMLLAHFYDYYFRNVEGLFLPLGALSGTGDKTMKDQERGFER